MKNIMVLGTGIAGMPLIRQIMRNVVLPSSEYKLTVISPNSDFVWVPALPRAVLPGQFDDEKIIYPLAPIFKDFPPDKFEFIQKAVSEVDPDRKVVRAGDREVEYHTLIVATGSSTKDGFPWKIAGDSEETRKMLHETQREIKAAASIAVIGGGVTGAETAGELGYEYAREGKKEVHFIYSAELPLASSGLERSRKQTVVELERLNVQMVPSTHVTKTTKLSDGKTKLELQNKDGSVKTLTVDTVLPATGMAPNTSFLPKPMLNEHGNVVQDGYLRAPEYPDIFIAGDAGSLEPSQALFADRQIVWLIKHLPRYFSHNGELPPAPYKAEGSATPDVEVLTVGKAKGVGHFNSWRIPSLAIWWIKGRHMGTAYAGELAAGKRTITTVYEK